MLAERGGPGQLVEVLSVGRKEAILRDEAEDAEDDTPWLGVLTRTVLVDYRKIVPVCRGDPARAFRSAPRGWS